MNSHYASARKTHYAIRSCTRAFAYASVISAHPFSRHLHRKSHIHIACSLVASALINLLTIIAKLVSAVDSEPSLTLSSKYEQTASENSLTDSSASLSRMTIA